MSMFLSIKISKKFIFSFLILIFGISFFAISSFAGNITEKDDDCVHLPIIMYHGISKSPRYQGRYVISPEEFESDLKYIKDNQYNTIFVDDVINYVCNDTPLPENPIMITFDDGYYNNFLYAYPLLQKYNCKMVLSPIGKYTDIYSQCDDRNANYAHCTWDNINEMAASGLVEIQNHSYDMHTTNKKGRRNGAKKLKGESHEEYQAALTKDLTKMQQEILDNTGIKSQAFTFPFGAVSNDSIDILKGIGFKAALTCEEKTNKITHDTECLYHLNRFIRPHNISTEKLFSKISKK